MAKAKRGDTLVEVTITIGIFSMIAIAVASVMSSGTSGSQTALETTLARAEIDAQAEALRFVHSSYISNKTNEDAEGDVNANPYKDIWNQITTNAIDLSVNSEATKYNPDNCDALYSKEPGDNNTLYAQNAFILNTKKLSAGATAYIFSGNSTGSNVFAPTTTYPRLVFGNSSSNNESNDSLVSTTVRNNLYRAEGIYIVAVKDANTTDIVGDTTISPTSAFYDFYIRTCWYGTDANRPSTISTIVRLYDPDIRK